MSYKEIRERQAAWWREDDRVMSVYDEILAELKITNEEIQLIRVTLERIDRDWIITARPRQHPSPEDLAAGPGALHYRKG